MNYNDVFNKWNKYTELDANLKMELESIKDDYKEIEDRFYKNLNFGTGGLRGVIGAGINRMNIYTVRKATQGVADYIKETGVANPSVVIAYDIRHMSKEFAEEAALVLAQNNIKAHVFKKVTATPILSFAIRELEATAGIVITASHNPKEYNGYKVYWSDGGQITDNIANGITKHINKVEDELKVEALNKIEAENKGLLNWLSEELFIKYIQKTKDLVLREDIIQKVSADFKIVFTPLHGTGYVPVKNVLDEAGFKNILLVDEQVEPDPDFSTVKYPNPEEHEAFKMALILAKENDADIVMGTDPDADRVGVAVKNNEGQYVILTGNQLGALMIDYILQMRKYNNDISANAVVVKTIVTSSMGVNIAKSYGIDYLDVLTGFKYIGEKIKEFHEEKSHSFIFGYEESYGYLVGDYVRDKDAIQACLVAAEMAAYYKSKGITLYKRLQELFEEYGYYKEDLVSFTLKGIEGQERINRILNTLQTEKLCRVNNSKIALMRDYLNEREVNLITGEEKQTDLPKAKVFHYTLQDGSWFCIRPSGTEPKLKIYFSIVEKSAFQADQKLSELKDAVLNIIEKIQ